MVDVIAAHWHGQSDRPPLTSCERSLILRAFGAHRRESPVAHIVFTESVQYSSHAVT